MSDVQTSKHPRHLKGLDLKLKIISSLKSQTAAQVGVSLGLKPSALSYYLRELKALDVVRMVAYGTWEVVEANIPRLYEASKQIKRSSKQLQKKDPSRSRVGGGVAPVLNVPRAAEGGPKQDSVASHGFMFVLSIPNLARWNQQGRRKYLESREIAYVPIQQGERLTLMDWKVHLTNKSIVCYSPKGSRWYAETAKEGYSYAVYDFLRVIKRLEGMLGVNLQMSGQYKFKPTREHHALVKNALAKDYDEKKSKLHVYDDRGLWLLIDASEGPELETVRAGDDGRLANRRVQNLFNDAKKHDVVISDLLSNDQRIQEQLLTTAKNLNYYAENVARHVKVMEQMERTLKKIEEKVER